MDKLSLCRICLVEDVKMYCLISANLQELYERLTDMPFVTNDKKPVQVCYLCRVRIQNCHRLQATCLKSEEFLNKVMSNNELKQMESQDLNTLKTVHPLIRISCVPSTGKDTDDDTIDDNNDVKFDPSEITPDAQVKDELFEDDSFINEAVDIKLEFTVKDEGICTEDGDISDNSHTMQDTQLEHDIQLKPVKIILERIDLEQFEMGSSAAKNSKIDLLNGNTESTISNESTESELTVIQNKNIEKKIQTTGRAVIVKNKNIVKQMSLVDKYNLISHTQHMGENVYGCGVCGKSFTAKNNLVTHIRIHTGERPYRCITCNQSFTQKGHLITHTRIHTGERSYKCIVCGKSFNRKNHLVAHTRIHTGERPYNCITCNQSFTWKSSLVTHTRLHTGEERSYKCIVCGKSFNRSNDLVAHTRIHTGERPYNCITCNRSFIRKSNLVAHIRIHTGEERSYKYIVCGKSFNRNNLLVAHTRIHTRERPYKCITCNRSFIRKSNLVTHTRIHTGEERSYLCNVCGKSFNRKSNLVTHMITHC